MTSLLSAKKRAEEFAAAVDGRLDTELRPEYAEFVNLAGALRVHAAAAPAPRPDFAASLRERLMAEADTVLVRSPETAAKQSSLTLPTRRRSRERRFAIATSAIVLVGGTAGMAAAAQNALPGDALYGVKRGLEKAQTDLSRSDAGKGHHLLDQAASRLDEVTALVEESPQADVSETIDAFTIQANQGSELLLAQFAADRDPDLIADLHAFTAANLATLQDLAKSVPASGQAALADAAVAIQKIDAGAAAACQTCSDQPVLQAPALLRTSTSVQEALERAKASAGQLNNTHKSLTQGKQPQVTPVPAPSAGGTSGTLPEVKTPGLPTGPLTGTVKDAPKTVVNGLTNTVRGLTDGLANTLDTLLPDATTPTPQEINPPTGQ